MYANVFVILAFDADHILNNNEKYRCGIFSNGVISVALAT